MRQLLVDIRDFAYHNPGRPKDYRAWIACLLAFHYLSILILAARLFEQITLSVRAGIYTLFLIEMALVLIFLSVVAYGSWRLFMSVEKIPVPAKLLLGEYERKRRLALGVLAVGILFFISSLSMAIGPFQKVIAFVAGV